MVQDRRRNPRWPSQPNRESLWRVIDRLLERARAGRQLTTEILRLEAELRRQSRLHVWDLYLDIEELRARRTALWLLVVARWAHAEGRRTRGN